MVKRFVFDASAGFVITMETPVVPCKYAVYVKTFTFVLAVILHGV